jgi:L-alanine-DL-glutamate epimerase-like enolase superfamily enzyme
MGFHGAKYPLEYGPEAGEKGMRLNIESAKKWRELVGPDFPLMLDCYMALDVQYVTALLPSHTRTHAHLHARTHARTHTRTHARTHAHR